MILPSSSLVLLPKMPKVGQIAKTKRPSAIDNRFCPQPALLYIVPCEATRGRARGVFLGPPTGSWQMRSSAFSTFRAI